MGSTRRAEHEQFDIWQWNCRGYRRKQGLLQQYINTHLMPPTVIALQETGGRPVLQGYEVYEGPTQGKVAVLVDRTATAISHDAIPNTNVEHVVVEIVTTKAKRQAKSSIFVVNLYCPPGKKGHNLLSSSREHAS